MIVTIADNIDTILVDFFDTVVERTCHPEVVKRKWVAALIDSYHVRLSVEELYALRLRIEAGLCVSSQTQGDDAEFCYDDMSLALYYELQRGQIVAQLPELELFISYCRDLELALELSVQQPIVATLDMLRSEKAKGKKIYLVSDFYLDKQSIIHFATHHGFADIFDSFFVSSENKRTKKEGRAYDVVIAKLGLDVKRTIMLGDNAHSDIVMSKARGLFAHHLPVDQHRYDANLQADRERNRIEKKINQVIAEDKFSFSWVSCAIYLFTRRLYWVLATKKAKNVYFFAREGEFLQKAFDKYQATLPANFARINTHYMYVSRRATYLPSLGPLSSSAFNKLLYQYGSCSLSAFLKSINLDEYVCDLKKRFPQVNFEEQHLNIAALPGFIALMEDEEFKSIYDRERNEQNTYLNEYCNVLMAEKCDEPVHVVDVGWKGSIQDNLAKVTQRQVVGYYFGILDGAECHKNNIKEGLLFDHQWGQRVGDDMFNEFRAGFEVFMGASHGSLKRYGDSVENFVFDHNEAEIALYHEQIAPFQQRALHQFSEFAKLERIYSVSDHEIGKAVKKAYFRGVMLPSRHEREKFASIKHYENFGVFNFSSFGQNKRSALSYFKRMAKNPRHTIGSAWWKPLDFHANGVGYLKYPYLLIKKIKSKGSK
ncbi:HAD-IA family hydrolase [Serratia proteamaculans]|uniref:HAD-IA family hydrolase n=1 Tax=Serratia proteamaculans TaxID=28151 RepID=A0A5Q2V2V7_SERPR|nr:HAD-IA family hydrolase [Serratia proteamaculans]QGH59722.1 HAD-IA family hydrolase [Serratia proteamaculans]